MRIATDEQKLSCTFTLDVPGLGYLEGGTEADVRLSHFSVPCCMIAHGMFDATREKSRSRASTDNRSTYTRNWNYRFG